MKKTRVICGSCFKPYYNFGSWTFTCCNKCSDINHTIKQSSSREWRLFEIRKNYFKLNPDLEDEPKY